MANELLKLKGSVTINKGIASNLSPSLVQMVKEGKEKGRRLFAAILTHIGTNNNGLELTREEAKKAVAAFKPFLLRMNQEPVKRPEDYHEKSAKTIIGKAIALEFMDDGEPRLEYVGEVYSTTPECDHAYQIIEDGFFDHDSYEVDFEEGECSQCAKRFRSANEACSHLAVIGKSPNRLVVGGAKAHVIMHGVTIKGAAMLDQPGGDPRAKIKAVAASLINEASQIKEKQMSKEKKEETPEVELSETETLQARIDELEAENKTLKKENGELQATVESFEKEKKENRVNALIALQEAKGIVFADEKAKETERAELMELDDKALAREEARINRLPDKAEADPEPEPEPEPEPDDPPKGQASATKPQGKLAAQAANSKRPATVPDTPGKSLREITEEFIEADKNAKTIRR